MKRAQIKAISFVKEQIRLKEKALVNLRNNLEVIPRLAKGVQLRVPSGWATIDVIGDNGISLTFIENKEDVYIPWSSFFDYKWRIR